MDKFNKYWGILVAVIGVIAGVFGWIYNKGAESKSIEGRIFDSPEQRVYVVTKVEELPTPQEAWQEYYLDSIDTADRIKSRKTRDSLMILEHEARVITDSINRLNADQIYQIKEELKAIKNGSSNP